MAVVFVEHRFVYLAHRYTGSNATTDALEDIGGRRSAGHNQPSLSHFAGSIAPADELETFHASGVRDVRSAVDGHEQIAEFFVAIQGIHHRRLDPAIPLRLRQRHGQREALRFAGGKHGSGQRLLIQHLETGTIHAGKHRAHHTRILGEALGQLHRLHPRGRRAFFQHG